MPKRRTTLLATLAAATALALLLVPRSVPPAQTQASPQPSPTTTAATAPDSPQSPNRITLDRPSGIRRVGARCWPQVVMDINLDHQPPPVIDEGSWLDRLGSRALAHTHDELVPSKSTRQRFESWGLTPAWFGRQIRDVSPWMAMVALDTERSWNETRRRQQRQAFEAEYGVGLYSSEGRRLRREDPAADALASIPNHATERRLAQELTGDDALGQRARLYLAHARQMQQLSQDPPPQTLEAHMQQQADDMLELLHATDDPELLGLAAAQLGQGWYRATPADDARIVEVMQVLPPVVGRPVALARLGDAWNRGDHDAVLYWWDAYQPLVEHCKRIPQDEWPTVGCGCVTNVVDGHLAALMNRGWLTPKTPKDHVRLAAARCYAAGHRPAHRDVDPASDLGRCIQKELGPEPVLGRDIHLTYDRVE